MLAITWDPTGTHAEVRRAPGAEALTPEQILIQPNDVYFSIPYPEWARYEGQVVDVLHLQYHVAAKVPSADDPAQTPQEADSRHTRIGGEFAVRHPIAYLTVMSVVFYGCSSLFDDIASSFGWAGEESWPSRLLTALIFGGIMLGVARRWWRSARATA